MTIDQVIALLDSDCFIRVSVIGSSLFIYTLFFIATYVASIYTYTNTQYVLSHV